MKTGVYVGSFNPPHKGHKKIIDYLLENNYLDNIIVIPTKEYWHKTNLLSIDHRINMLKKYETDKIKIDDKLNKYEYTYQILNELKKEYNDLYLIIGADNLEKLNMWKNIDEILLNKIIVINRSDIDSFLYINNFKEKDKFTVVNIEPINISSTYIREHINSNELNDLLESDVLNYIKENHLYES